MAGWHPPEEAMFEAPPRHPVAKTKEKRTVQIKPDVHRFEVVVHNIGQRLDIP
jgi:hypothetical protein